VATDSKPRTGHFYFGENRTSVLWADRGGNAAYPPYPHFPHPTCVYPDPLQFSAAAAQSFTPEERAKVFGLNAARLYKIDLDAIPA
jgi:hypothetical protein